MKNSLKHEHWVPNHYSRLCSDHFEKKFFDINDQSVRLREGAIPTLFKLPHRPLEDKETDKKKTIPASSSKCLAVMEQCQDDKIDSMPVSQAGGTADMLYSADECEANNAMEDVAAEPDSMQNTLQMVIHLCRLCMQDTGKQIEVFGDQGLQLELAAKLHTVLPIKVDPNDLLPLSICEHCVEQLELSYKLLLKTIETDNRLREMFQLEKEQVHGDNRVEEEVERDVWNDELHLALKSETMEKCVQTEVSLSPKHRLVLALHKKKVQIKPAIKESGQRSSNRSTTHVEEQGASLQSVAAEQGEADYLATGENIDKDCVSEAEEEVESQTETRVTEEHNYYSSRPQTFVKKMCDKCPFVGKTADETNEHQLSHLPIVFQCRYCPQEFVSKTEQKAHTRKCRLEKRQQVCEQCGKLVSRKYLTAHMLLHTKDRRYICEQCGSTFYSPASLAGHRQSHGPHKQLCEICGRSFSRQCFWSHRRRHLNPQRLLNHHCAVCNKGFRERKRMLEHQRIHTNERPYKCSQCDRAFTSSHALRQHSETHSGHPHECQICGKRFNRITNMRNHAKIHLQNAFRTCSVCEQRFDDQSKLLEHLQSHSQEELQVAGVACTVCGHLAVTRAMLSKHMKQHHPGQQRSKLHSCTHCSKAFVAPGMLQNHLRVHTGQRPFVCSECGAAFHTKLLLRQHCITHLPVAPHKCHLCSKAFRRAENLRLHLRTHTGEKPYSCQVCGRAFTQRGDCLKHERNVCKLAGSPVQKPHICRGCGRSFAKRGDCYKHEFNVCKVPSLVSPISSADVLMQTLSIGMPLQTTSLLF